MNSPTPSSEPGLGHTAVALCAITLLGAQLRFWDLDSRSLWMDEALSWRMQSFPVVELIARTAEPATCHPPLFFLVLKAWTAVWGDSELSLRLMPCLAGVALIPAMYGWGAELCRWAPHVRAPLAGLAAAAMTAVNPMQIHLSQQVRGYSLAALLAALSAWLMLRALRADGGAGRWLAWAMAAVLLCYTHHLGPVTVAAEVLFAGVVLCSPAPGAGATPGSEAALSRPQHWGTPLAAAALVGLAYLPWLSHAFGQAGTLGESFRQDLTARSMAAAVYTAFVQDPNTQETNAVLRAGAVVLVVGLHLAVWFRGKSAGLFLILWSVVPAWVLFSFSVSSLRSIFVARYLFMPQLGWTLMAALVPFLFRRIPFRVAGGALVAALVAANLAVTMGHLGQPRQPGMRGAVAHLRANAASEEPILALAPQVFLTAKPYLPADGRLRLASSTLDRHSHSGAPLLLDSDLVPPDWPRASGARSFWLIRSDSYRILAREDAAQLQLAAVRDYRRLSVTRWPQENWWEQPIVVEHYAEVPKTARSSQ